MQEMRSLNDLFVTELKDMYSAEHQIMQALPKMIDAASSTELKDKFRTHLEVTKHQAERLEQIFSMLNMQPEEEFCVGMAGLIKEGEHLIEAKGGNAVRDAGLIAAAQKVEHYEISAYGTLRTFANTLGMTDVASLLNDTLTEESNTDELLTNLAVKSINKEAA